MAEIRIRYVDKDRDHHEGITDLGSAVEKYSRREVIRRIESKQDDFYTEEKGKKAYVAVRDGVHGKYVQTHADGYWNNNLLALPRCPASLRRVA
jgi:hypothetical protein